MKQTKTKKFGGTTKYSVQPNAAMKASVKLLKAVDKEKKIVAVIVSFVSSNSYDHLFTSVEQQAEEGTQVLVYSVSSNSVKMILEAFEGKVEDEVVTSMVDQIKELDSDCVVFNWECCQGYSEERFAEGKGDVFRFVDAMLKRGHMLMFSDFSLKALIKDWDAGTLGPNPFVKVSEFGGDFQLSFDCNKLRDCPSAQLQVIGEMAAEGHCNVNAMGGTIVYGVKQEHQNDFYDLEVLSVASSLKTEGKYLCKSGEKSGAAGHVLLKYKKGGFLLTSMGHWIELMKIDTTEKALFDVAEK